MRHLLIVLLVLLFSGLTFGQDNSKVPDYQLMQEYNYYLQKYIQTSMVLYYSDSLLEKYRDYKDHVNDLWDNLEKFQKFLAKNKVSYLPKEWNILLSRANTLSKIEKKIDKKYRQLKEPEKKANADWKQFFRNGTKYTVAATMLAAMYSNHDWEMNPARNQEFVGTAVIIPVTQKFGLTFGHFQGVAIGAKYRLQQSFPEAGGLTEPLEIWVNSQVVLNGNKTFRKATLGGLVQFRLISGLYIYSGFSYQLYFNKVDLVNDPEARTYWVPSIGFFFNPFY